MVYGKRRWEFEKEGGGPPWSQAEEMMMMMILLYTNRVSICVDPGEDFLPGKWVENEIYLREMEPRAR